MKEAKKLLFKNKSAVLSVLIGAHLLGIPFVNDSNLIDPKLISRYLYVSLGLVVFTLVFFIFLINANKKFDVNPIWQLPVCLLSVSYITTVFYAHNTTEAVFWANKITLFATAFLLFLYFRIYDLVNFKIIGVFVALMVLASIALFFIEAEKKELLLLDNIKTFAFDCALHIAAFNPVALSPENVSQDYIKEMEAIYKKRLYDRFTDYLQPYNKHNLKYQSFRLLLYLHQQAPGIRFFYHP